MAKILYQLIILTLFITGHICRDTTDNVSSSPSTAEAQSPVTPSVDDVSIKKPSSTPSEVVTNAESSPTTREKVVTETSSSEASMKSTEDLVKTTAESPTDVTTPTPELTTTEKTTTTTTTAEPTTSEPLPTTVAPSLPSKNNFYNVTQGDVVCVMFDGEITLSITYNIGADKTNQTVISLPKHDEAGVHVAGSCDLSSQWIEVSWGKTFPKSSLRLNFKNLTQSSWEMTSVAAIIPLDNSTFVNATDNGKALSMLFNMTRLSFASNFNESYQCYAELTNKNGTVTMEDQKYEYPVSTTLKHIKVQAYNQIAKVDNFVHAVHCSEDKIADLVPIGVGCALAALIIFVLIAYVVGRRRRSLAYQSV